MKAIVQDVYGSPAVLAYRDIGMPAVGPHEVLVRVHAAGLHVGDCFGVRGFPLPVRLFTGLLRPSPGVPGSDLAGHVEATGAMVTAFRTGDAVFGAGHGTCAEYATAPEARLAHKPPSLTFEQAAAVPTSALAALHGLRDAGRLQAGQRVLIIGASGGIGTFAVQIAKARGAEVTGVCSSTNVALIRSLGADQAIDYTREDFAHTARGYDLVFDNVENRSLSDCRKALTPNGTLILNSGTGARGFHFWQRLVTPLLLSPFVGHTLRRYLSTPNYADLVVLTELIEAGALKAVLDRTFPLQKTPSALHYIEAGHARGKVVISIDDLSASR